MHDGSMQPRQAADAIGVCANARRISRVDGELRTGERRCEFETARERWWRWDCWPAWCCCRPARSLTIRPMGRTVRALLAMASRPRLVPPLHARIRLLPRLARGPEIRNGRPVRRRGSCRRCERRDRMGDGGRRRRQGRGVQYDSCAVQRRRAAGRIVRRDLSGYRYEAAGPRCSGARRTCLRRRPIASTSRRRWSRSALSRSRLRRWPAAALRPRFPRGGPDDARE